MSSKKMHHNYILQLILLPTLLIILSYLIIDITNINKAKEEFLSSITQEEKVDINYYFYNYKEIHKKVLNHSKVKLLLESKINLIRSKDIKSEIIFLDNNSNFTEDSNLIKRIKNDYKYVSSMPINSSKIFIFIKNNSILLKNDNMLFILLNELTEPYYHEWGMNDLMELELGLSSDNYHKNEIVAPQTNLVNFIYIAISFFIYLSLSSIFYINNDLDKYHYSITYSFSFVSIILSIVNYFTFNSIYIYSILGLITFIIYLYNSFIFIKNFYQNKHIRKLTKNRELIQYKENKIKSLFSELSGSKYEESFNKNIFAMLALVKEINKDSMSDQFKLRISNLIEKTLKVYTLNLKTASNMIKAENTDMSFEVEIIDLLKKNEIIVEHVKSLLVKLITIDSPDKQFEKLSKEFQKNISTIDTIKKIRENQ